MGTRKKRRTHTRCSGLRGPKRVACEGRETITVPAHTRCASSLKRSRARARDASELDCVYDAKLDAWVCPTKPRALPSGTNGIRRTKRRGVGDAPRALPGGCTIQSETLGEQTYYWTECGDEGTVAELYVTRAKPAKDACRGASRKCVRALLEQPLIRTVDEIEVTPFARRKGHATKLYERAARDACVAGEPLVSYMRIPASASHAFWAKQHQKGRAVAVGAYKRPTKQGGSELVSEQIYMLQCGRHEDLSGVKRKFKRKR